MVTIVEPKQRFSKLWGKQCIREDQTYRMMKYVLRVDYKDKVLLHNVVSGQLVVLDQEEAEVLGTLPAFYSIAMEQLVNDHYLVEEHFDEHQQVVKMRKILRMLDKNQRGEAITHYTILPTTACNARCYYCFEQGAKTTTMTKQIADDIVDYIDKHCGKERKIVITWFGGEPTVASDRIDQICEGLKDRQVLFESEMVTNGYLFDEEMIHRGKNLWNLKYLQISVDGTEEHYIETKSFVEIRDNPYARVLKNVGCLIENGISVGLRMNFDLYNFQDFAELVQDLSERFQNNTLLSIYAYPIIGDYPNHSGVRMHGDDAWFSEKLVELNRLARKTGVLRIKTDLPYLHYVACRADNDCSVAITAEGKFVRCSEQFGPDQVVGSVKEGVVNADLVREWKVLGDPESCINCYFFPMCLKLVKCSAIDRCFSKLERTDIHSSLMRSTFDAWNETKN